MDCSLHTQYRRCSLPIQNRQGTHCECASAYTECAYRSQCAYTLRTVPCHTSVCHCRVDRLPSQYVLFPATHRCTAVTWSGCHHSMYCSLPFVVMPLLRGQAAITVCTVPCHTSVCQCHVVRLPSQYVLFPATHRYATATWSG